MNEVATIPASGVKTLAPQGNAAAMTAQMREMAEALASVQMAKMFPRNVVAVRDKILNACTRPSLAGVACYTYVKGGSEVSGPSIRLAEMMMQYWGNAQFGIRELEQRNGESTCEAFAWDMETNSRHTKVFQVSHIRHTRTGDYAITDPREIYELVANNGARRLRACILGIIPGDIVEEAVEKCNETLSTKFEVTSERTKAMLAKFEEYKVTREQIEKRIQRRIDAMTPVQMKDLGNIYNSLKDGMSKPEYWFDKEETVPTGESKEVAADRPKEAKAKLVTALAGVKRDGDMSVEDVM